MANVLVDTDVLVDHFRGAARLRRGGDRLWCSVITRAELFIGGDERRIRDYLDRLGEVPVDRDIAERAGRIRRITNLLLPDALIAATALERRLTLLTLNVTDFRRVTGLRVRSPA
jgi:hypothetical protein